MSSISIFRSVFISVLLLSSVLVNSAFANVIVNDVTNINPIAVADVLAPKTTSEIQDAVRKHKGPIAIGGGRYSMGGQTATEGALQIDMRSFNKIVSFDPAAKRITVQAGITWRDIQGVLDSRDLSVMIMQSYSNFTVGGSLSVNAHGRYVGAGPVVNSVEELQVVLADGSLVRASRVQNPEIFFGVIGGYGGLGVIAEVTLKVVPNERIRRESVQMPIESYRDYFTSKIRPNPDAVLHNGDIYPPDYKSVRAETWWKTGKPVTVSTRLVPSGAKYWLDPTAVSLIATLPFGSELRRKVLEPALLKKDVVVWRNFEASYDVARLEPTTPRWLWTYVLQEYFVPVDKFDEFVPKLRAVLSRHPANILNISIRHSPADPGTLLAWAPEESFSFVIYYRQGTSESAKREVAVWTRELIDAALSVNGRYYLPYQIHATPAQFRKAYPKADQFFALKKKIDPDTKFRNKLWDAYN